MPLTRRAFVLGALAAVSCPGDASRREEVDGLTIEVNLLTQEGTILSGTARLDKGDTVKLISVEGEGIKRRIRLALRRESGG